MANVDNPHGLRPLGRRMGGGEPEIAFYDKAATYGTAIFIWDAVNRVADGTIDKTATPGSTNYSGVSLTHGAALTLTRHPVIIDPFAFYEAQDNNATDGFAAADMGLNADLQLNAGSATTQISGHEVNETGAAADATFDVHVHEKLDTPDNAYGGWCRLVITFNKHRMFGATVGV